MIYRLAADGLLLLHLLFILFVLAGGVLALWKPSLVWLHVPAAIWGMLIEFIGWTCPLTPMENHLRKLSGNAGYKGGFIEHYLMPLIYPDWLTLKAQFVLGSLVLLVNILIYSWLWHRGTWKRK
ncbi:MAG: DUF2784 domain-containing protein [Hydrogenophilaceae bacterium]|nr:DUF2784 domain-containing protein [Hydrogenophilaceae bacterium]